MKPRNIFEKAVLAQSEKLRPIVKVQEKWAFRNCIDHYAYRLPKGRTTCMDCGHTWLIEQERKLCSCPNCKAELKVRNTRGRNVQQKQGAGGIRKSCPVVEEHSLLGAVACAGRIHCDSLECAVQYAV